MDNFIITIARGFGSGGREIAAMLADELKVHSFENRILTMASQLSGYDEHYFVEQDEQLKGNLLLNKLANFPKHFGSHPVTTRFVSNEVIYDFQKKIIEELADSSSCVIVGKCADHILKDRNNVLSVYIEAPRDYCRAQVMDRLDVDEKEADKLITKTDKYRADYYAFYTKGNYWTNPVNYDLTLNSGRLSKEACVKVILKALEEKMGKAFFDDYMFRNS